LFNKIKHLSRFERGFLGLFLRRDIVTVGKLAANFFTGIEKVATSLLFFAV